MSAIQTPLADDGFGNLISTLQRPERSTSVFARVDGKLARWEVGTGDPETARGWISAELPVKVRPVFALIEGGKH